MNNLTPMKNCPGVKGSPTWMPRYGEVKGLYMFHPPTLSIILLYISCF